MRCTDDLLLSRALETCMVLWTNVTPINLIFEKDKIKWKWKCRIRSRLNRLRSLSLPLTAESQSLLVSPLSCRQSGIVVKLQWEKFVTGAKNSAWYKLSAIWTYYNHICYMFWNGLFICLSLRPDYEIFESKDLGIFISVSQSPTHSKNPVKGIYLCIHVYTYTFFFA